MGDAAEMTLNGILDFYTGEYTGKNNIYYPKYKYSKSNPTKGVTLYLQKRYAGISVKIRKDIVLAYSKSIDNPLKISNYERTCRDLISPNFGNFIKWIKENIPVPVGVINNSHISHLKT